MPVRWFVTQVKAMVREDRPSSVWANVVAVLSVGPLYLPRVLKWPSRHEGLHQPAEGSMTSDDRAALWASTIAVLSCVVGVVWVVLLIS